MHHKLALQLKRRRGLKKQPYLSRHFFSIAMQVYVWFELSLRCCESSTRDSKCQRSKDNFNTRVNRKRRQKEGFLTRATLQFGSMMFVNIPSTQEQTTFISHHAKARLCLGMITSFPCVVQRTIILTTITSHGLLIVSGWLQQQATTRGRQAGSSKKQKKV